MSPNMVCRWRATEFAGIVVVEDARFDEPRRLYGTIDGIAHCAAVTMRGNIVPLRRAHAKEMRRYGF